jgi:hypothetical protein
MMDLRALLIDWTQWLQGRADRADWPCAGSAADRHAWRLWCEFLEERGVDDLSDL